MSDSNLNNISFGKNLLIAASIGTGALTTHILAEIDNTPKNKYSVNLTQKSPLSEFKQIDLPAGFTFVNEKAKGQIELERFIREISINSKDLDPEIRAVIDKNFWEMI